MKAQSILACKLNVAGKSLFHSLKGGRSMPSWFELSVSNGTQYRFVLKANNGEIVLSSGGYESLSEARNAIGFVQAFCQLDRCYEKRTAHNSQSYFVLKGAGSEVVGMSQPYPSDVERDAAINSMKVIGKTGITINNT